MDYRSRLSPRTREVLARMEVEKANDNWGPTTPPGELDLICDLLAARGCRRVLELGTWLGHTAITMADLCGFVLTVDVHPGAQAVCRDYAAQAGVHVETVLGSSLDPDIACRSGESFDAIFLDTSHRYADTVAELAAYAPRSPLMLLHDCSVNEPRYDDTGGGGVRRAFYEWLAAHLDWRGEIREKPDYPDAFHGLGVLYRP